MIPLCASTCISIINALSAIGMRTLDIGIEYRLHYLTSHRQANLLVKLLELYVINFGTEIISIDEELCTTDLPCDN